MIHLMAFCGLRVSEMTGLNADHHLPVRFGIQPPGDGTGRLRPLGVAHMTVRPAWLSFGAKALLRAQAPPPWPGTAVQAWVAQFRRQRCAHVPPITATAENRVLSGSMPI